MARTRSGSIITPALEGAIAGVIATWLMGRVTTVLYERENAAARRREDAARNGSTSYEVAAAKLAGLAGRRLSDDERGRYGSALHWGLGAAMGAAYGVLRERMPGATAGAGLLFGSLFFLAVDEALTPALGLTPGPRAFPWQTHARGLAGHLAYGAAAETTLTLLQRD